MGRAVAGGAGKTAALDLAGDRESSRELDPGGESTGERGKHMWATKAVPSGLANAVMQRRKQPSRSSSPPAVATPADQSSISPSDLMGAARRAMGQ